MSVTETEIMLLECLEYLRDHPVAEELTARVEAYFRERNKPLTIAELEAIRQQWREKMKLV